MHRAPSDYEHPQQNLKVNVTPLENIKTFPQKHNNRNGYFDARCSINWKNHTYYDLNLTQEKDNVLVEVNNSLTTNCFEKTKQCEKKILRKLKDAFEFENNFENTCIPKRPQCKRVRNMFKVDKTLYNSNLMI